MRNRYTRAVVFVCLGLSAFVAGPVAARGLRATTAPADGPSAEALAEKAARAVKAQEKLAGLIERQSVRPVDAKVVEEDARRLVGAWSDEQIQGFLGGDSLNTILTSERYTAKTATTAKAAAAAATLGDPQSDLIFVPVTPCRIIDTRLAGGAIAANSMRSFLVTGSTGFEGQGGKSGGCGIPQGASTPLAAAVVINFVAVGPQGPGDMRAWPFGQTKPLAAVLNYANVPGLNIANGIVVPIAGTSDQPDDLSVSTDVSGTHLVADVTGYFTRFPVEQFQGSLKSTVAEVNDSTLTDLGSGACTQVNSCTITAPADGKVIVGSWVGVVANHAQGTTDKVAFGFETASPVTCGWQADSSNASVMTASAGLGTNIDYDMTLSHGATYPITSGTTQTYYLSIQWLAGANTGDQYENSRMICTFIPN
jgi:hypothetical protein